MISVITATNTVNTTTKTSTTDTSAFATTMSTAITTTTAAPVATTTTVPITATTTAPVATTTTVPITATTTAPVTATTTAPVTATTINNTVMSNSLTTSNPDGSDSNSVAVIVVIVVAILLVAIIVTILVVIFFWRKNKKNNKLGKKPPLCVTRLSTSENDYSETLNDNDSQGLSKNNLELQRKLPDCQAKSPAEILAQSQNQTLLVTSPDYERTKETDHSSVTEGTTSNPIFSFESSGYSVLTEPINLTAFMSDKVCDSKDNDGLAPCTSIYADPIPLMKAKEPPVVTVDNIKPIRELGTGLFGQVILANTVGLSYQYLGIGSSNDTSISMKVAVKILKTPATAEIKKAFDKEIRFMTRLKDDNVIRLLGICTTGTSFIMMEYMENGDLNGYLQKLNFTTDTTKVPAANEMTLNGLVYISYQIASGMKYLSSCKYVHRDLAARNILVGINQIVKIADFGMSQNLYSAYYCRVGGRSVLPIRWLAYECFFGKFSVKTDVWAFGITLWEIFTLCRFLPYDEFTNEQMAEDVTRGAKRLIPSQPENCPDDIYCIMKSCFQHDPSKRPEFSILCNQLNDYYTSIL